MDSRLPIEAILPELKRALAAHDAAVLQAPPGAGKTTRVPLALLAEPWLAGKSILMLEPRRLAATNAARYMAGLLEEKPGETVGFAIRFERRVSSRTRLEVVTEGILTRRLQADPELAGVGLVIFDEFHERSLHADLALALCREVQQGLRPDLRLLVMSATLDGEPVARLLGGAPVVTSAGRSYPVAIRYLGDPPGRVEEAAAAAVRRALRETAGDLLVFLPGAGEIRRCRELLAAQPLPGEPLLTPLYGDLPFVEQERAILPGGRRKVVLATNIAETSLTIEGVGTVIDGGLERRSRFEPAAGISRLETVRISRASAEQRAGRAGRLGPGVCWRLWGEGTHGSLLPFTPPEIRSADLAPLALELARWGVAEAAGLVWLDPPSPGALAGARQLLQRLGAVDGQNRLTPLGEKMAGLPAHPRLARLLLAAVESGLPALGSDLAALLSERDLFRRDRLPSHQAESDLLDRLEALQQWRQRRSLPAGADPAACAAVDRAARHFRQALGREVRERETAAGGAEEAQAASIGRLLALAWPDRIGGEREPGSGRYLLASGQGARLSPASAVRQAGWLVAVEVAGKPGKEGEIRLASVLGREDIEALFAARLTWQRESGWDERGGRVTVREVRRLGSLLVQERPAEAGPEEVVAALLAAVRREGLEILGWTGEARQWVARVRFLRQTMPEEEWPDLAEERLLESLEEWLAPSLAGVRSRADLARLDPGQGLQSLLPWPQRRRLEELAPTHLEVPSGHRVPLDYAAPDPPVLAVKLQELFGLGETPRLAAGRVAVLLHLLSPARRPIQVTRDLKSFWRETYPEVKKELKGRYPKHPWPDDPWSAEPTRRTRR